MIESLLCPSLTPVLGSTKMPESSVPLYSRVDTAEGRNSYKSMEISIRPKADYTAHRISSSKWIF